MFWKKLQFFKSGFSKVQNSLTWSGSEKWDKVLLQYKSKDDYSNNSWIRLY